MPSPVGIWRTRTKDGRPARERGQSRRGTFDYRKALAEYKKLGTESSKDINRRSRAIMVHGGIGEMQARLGDRYVALAECSRAIALLDGIAPDPISGTLSSLRGKIYMRVAAAYAALGASRKTRRGGAGNTRRPHATCMSNWPVWQDMKTRGSSRPRTGPSRRKSRARSRVATTPSAGCPGDARLIVTLTQGTSLFRRSAYIGNPVSEVKQGECGGASGRRGEESDRERTPARIRRCAKVMPTRPPPCRREQ